MTPEYKERLVSGLKYERFLGVNEKPGENEVKLDRRFRETGNLYIELLERPSTNVPFNPCGPFHRDAPKTYLIGDKYGVYKIPVEELIKLSRGRRFVGNDQNRAYGFLLPCSSVEKYYTPMVGNDDSVGDSKMRDCGAQGNTHTRS